MPDDNSFFRPEVIEARRDRTGSPVANRGISMWMIVAFMTTIFILAAIFVALARYSKKETVLGEVVPPEGIVRVTAMRGGIIKKSWVASGARVEAGRPIFTISYDNALENGSFAADGMVRSTDDQIDLAESESIARERQLQQTRLGLQGKLASAERGLPLQRSQRALQAERVELLQKNFDAIRPLVEQQFISQLQVSNRRDNLLQARQSLLQIDQTIESDLSLIAELKSQISAANFAIEQARSNAQAAKAQLNERRLANLASQGGQIAALATGNLTNVQVKPGDVVMANQTLALISPESVGRRMQVVLWVPSRSVGFVKVGDKVRLMFDAFPYQTFGVGTGHVIEISTAPIMPDEVPVPIPTKEQMYKVTVGLDRGELNAYGRSWALLAGMRVTADLVLDEKSLLDWLLDPLAAVRNRSRA